MPDYTHANPLALAKELLAALDNAEASLTTARRLVRDAITAKARGGDILICLSPVMVRDQIGDVERWSYHARQWTQGLDRCYEGSLPPLRNGNTDGDRAIMTAEAAAEAELEDVPIHIANGTGTLCGRDHYKHREPRRSFGNRHKATCPACLALAEAAAEAVAR